MWRWTIACVMSCAAALWMDLSRGETALLLALSVLVVASGLINTVIERTVDLVTCEQHDLARKAKGHGQRLCRAGGDCLWRCAGGDPVRVIRQT